MRFCFPLLAVGLLPLASLTASARFLDDVRALPLTPVERVTLEDRSGKITQLPLDFTPFNAQRATVPFQRAIFTDRSTYMVDDPVGQVLVYCLTPVEGLPSPTNLTLELKQNDQVIATQNPGQDLKFAAELPLTGLKAGNYEISGSFEADGKVWNLTPARFVISSEKRRVEKIPGKGIPLVMQPAPVQGAQTSPIITGIPIPRHQALSASEFTLLENGKPVSAQFSERATWYPGREVKWLGLSFLAKYQDGKPAEYRVIHKSPSAPASPLTVEETAEAITINTGAISFEIGKMPFTGIRSVKRSGQDSPTVSGPGGPFLVDEREVFYSSELDETAEVTIEESGPTRVTVLAKGWLTNIRNERLCRYETRFTAWAGQSDIDVQQRTIVTFNTDEKRLQRHGFAVAVNDPKLWSAGLDGRALGGEVPAAAPAPKSKAKKPVGPVAPLTTGWMIQSRDDAVSIENADGEAGSGKKADGWVRLQTEASGDVLLNVRHLWQMFPKEIAWGPKALVIYQWPEHGRDAFTAEEELNPDHIHKIRYAHEGRYLDLKFPQKYFDTLRKTFPPIIENQDINALSGNGMGLAITTDFRLSFAEEFSDAKATDANRMFAADLHGISDPVWNGLTEVEGRFAGRQVGVTDDWDRFFDHAFKGFKSSVDVLGDYGMWIWPDVHNNWSVTLKRPQPHRWWLNSHYQNVWDYNFMYFISANPDYKDWANPASRHFMDVGTVNFSDPDRPLLGKLPGANYHVKGFTPWGSGREGEVVNDDYVEVAAHFINPDASLFRYLLFGQHTGLQLANQWFDSLGRVAMPPERSREACTTLGELISYYENTWDPQAISYIHELGDAMLSRPAREVPAFPAHPFFHDRWVMRYWNLTGDKRIQDFVIPALASRANYVHRELFALAWKWTGDKSFLETPLAGTVPPYGSIYQNPGDPVDGFGERVFKPTHSLTQIVPYYIQAVLDAGLKLPTAPRPTPSIAKGLSLPKKGKPTVRFNGTSAAQLEVQGTPKIRLFVQAATMTETWENRGMPGNVEVKDASGKVIAKTSLLAGSQRPEATLELDGEKFPQPWTISVHGTILIGWDGEATAVTLAPLPKSSTNEPAEAAGEEPPDSAD